MKHTIVLRSLGSLALTGVLGLGLLGASGGSDAVTSADTQFAQSAMHMLLQGVSNADAAQGGDSSVKGLATGIQTDEIAIGNQLASLASYYGINVSTDSPKASTDAAGYAADQAHDLPELIALFEQEKDGGGSAQLRSFASQALPTLQKDLAAVQAGK
ncbi:MAG TPA: DUF4142 domain-containing protein [Candidatus Acidoferrales bacterium]|nr:DUF4142 domain-containing protein [Candidatus Acidoferrales bacterium]